MTSHVDDGANQPGFKGQGHITQRCVEVVVLKERKWLLALQN